MKRVQHTHAIVAATAAILFTLAVSARAHTLVTGPSPTNQSRITWSVSDTAGYRDWRAYVRCLTDNRAGGNTAWSQAADGWWYRQVTLGQDAAWDLTGLPDQSCTVTYWLFKADGTWEFGAKRDIVSDRTSPVAALYNPTDEPGARYIKESLLSLSAFDSGSGMRLIRVLIGTPPGESVIGWARYTTNEFYKDFSGVTDVYEFFTMSAYGQYNIRVEATDAAGNITRIDRKYFTVGSNDPPPAPAPVLPPPPVIPPPPAPVPEPTSRVDGFIMPVDTEDISSWKPASGSCYWYDYQPFGSLFQYQDRMHLGADVNYICGDQGLPVRAVYDCVIADFSDTAENSSWGKWVSLRCNAPADKPFRLSDGITVNSVVAFYAHLGEVALVDSSGARTAASSFVKGVTPVRRGDRVGTVGNANGYYGSAYHLHFEIRIDGFTGAGSGYADPADTGRYSRYIDSVEFIRTNRVLAEADGWTVAVHPYDRLVSRRVYAQVDGTQWQRTGRTSEGGVQSLGYANHIFVARTVLPVTAAWRFTVPVTGAYDVHVFIPRNHASASAVTYTVQHSDTAKAQPYRLTVNQASPTGNRAVYLGTFHYETGRSYVVALDAPASDPAREVAYDTLALTYLPLANAGGGTVSQVDTDGDSLPDEWEYAHWSVLTEDGAGDPDRDGLDNGAEYFASTDPTDTDTDGDGVSDGDEVSAGTNPADPDDVESPVPESEAIVVPYDGSVRFTLAANAAAGETGADVWCQGAGWSWGDPVNPSRVLAWTGYPSGDGEVICNALFYGSGTTTWLADSRGLSASHSLAVNGIPITALRDNGLDGKNIVFRLDYRQAAPAPAPTPTPAPDPEDGPPDSTHRVVVEVPPIEVAGCSAGSTGDTGLMLCISLLPLCLHRLIRHWEGDQRD